MASSVEEPRYILGRRSSSIYDNDDLMSETNSTGTQIHHRSYYQGSMDDLSLEHGSLSNERHEDSLQAGQRSISIYSPQHHSSARTQILSCPESTSDPNGQPSPEYVRFVLASGNAFNVEVEPLGRRSLALSVGSSTDDDDEGPRPPTPLRRRPPVPRLMEHAVERESSSASSISFEHATLSSSLKEARRQGRTDWSTEVSGSLRDRPSPVLVSSTGKVYGLGDHEAGYGSGVFVTDLQPSTTRDGKVRSELVKRLFCF